MTSEDQGPGDSCTQRSPSCPRRVAVGSQKRVDMFFSIVLHPRVHGRRERPPAGIRAAGQSVGQRADEEA